MFNASKKRTLNCALLLACILAGQVFAQTDSNWQLPRTIDGHPDLQGVWSHNTITPVERPAVFGDKEFLTTTDITFLQQRIAEITEYACHGGNYGMLNILSGHRAEEQFAREAAAVKN